MAVRVENYEFHSLNIFRPLTHVLILLLVSSQLSGTLALTHKEEEALKEVTTDAFNKFAVKLYREVAKDKEGSVFVSPVSAQVVLVLTSSGARGQTAAELRTLLSLPDSEDSLLAGYRALVSLLSLSPVSMANGVFVDKSAVLKEAFKKHAEEAFHAQSKQVNFSGNPDGSRTEINSWVENHTHHKITNLLQQGSIDSLTRVVLVNAIYFKDQWKVKFPPANTKKLPFYLTELNSVSVSMMKVKGDFLYKDDNDLKAKFLQLDYAHQDIRMVIILPYGHGLAKLESDLESSNLAEKLKQLRKKTVHVSLPKFKLEKTMDLEENLQALGVQAMFAGTADLHGISDEALQVSKIFQKTFVEVNEEGTQAAVTTGEVSTFSYNEFNADHPFIFVITHVKYDIPLFFGRYVAEK